MFTDQEVAGEEVVARGIGSGGPGPDVRRIGGTRPGTPPTNQGGSGIVPAVVHTGICEEGVRFGVDWLTLTCKGGAGILGEIVEGIYRGDGPRASVPFWLEQGHGVKFWGKYWKGPFGASLVADNVEGPDWAGVILPGQICRQLGIGGLVRVVRGVERLKREWRVTRIDGAWDGVPFSGEDCIAAAVDGAIGGSAKWMEYGTPPTRTFYLGMTGATRVCVYWKVEGQFNRCELRLWGRDRCTELGRLMARESLAKYEQSWRGMLGSFGKIQRKFWIDFVSRGVAVKFEKVENARVDRERVRRFVENTCGRSIAKYVACFGWAALERVVAQGAKVIGSEEWLELGVEFNRELVDGVLGRVGKGAKDG